MFGAIDFYQRPRRTASSRSSAARPTSRPTARQDRAPAQPPHPAREERGRLQEPVVPELDGLPRGLLLQPAHRQAAPARAQRGADRAVGVPGRRGRADAHAARAPRRPRTSRASTSDIFGRATSSSSCSRTASRSRRRSTASSSSMAKKTRHPARRHQRLPLREPGRRARARGPDVRAAEEDASTTRSGCSTASTLLHQDAGRDGRVLQAHPRGDREHRHASASCATSSSSSGRHVPAEVQGARRR